MKLFSDRLKQTLDEINDVKVKANRSDDVLLMAVSKTHPPEAIIEAIDANQLLFGENRVQEIEQKFPIENKEYKLHMIGHLQSNKVKKVVPLVDSIDSVDSEKLLRLINKEGQRFEKIVPILIEYNTSLESSKAGFTTLDAYYKALEVALTLPYIKIDGLMTIGPLGKGEKEVRGAFSFLYELKVKSETKYKELKMEVLSMGMSGDYKWAIQEGSTLVRIGTALFGQRSY